MFPACAGMNRLTISAGTTSGNVPRERGDEPYIAALQSFESAFVQLGMGRNVRGVSSRETTDQFDMAALLCGYHSVLMG